MALPSKKTTFTFNHADQVDNYAETVGNSAIVKSNFDSRAAELLTYINQIYDALQATTDGASGADQIKATAISGLTGDTVQELLEAIADTATWNGKATINAKTAAYSLVAGDVGEVLNFTESTGYTLTIPKNTTTALDVGFTVTVLKTGTGDVTIDPATDVTLNGGTDSLTLSDQYKAVTLMKIATDTWVAVGAI